LYSKVFHFLSLVKHATCTARDAVDEMGGGAREMVLNMALRFRCRNVLIRRRLKSPGNLTRNIKLSAKYNYFQVTQENLTTVTVLLSVTHIIY
jgi:hypothetical protein